MPHRTAPLLLSACLLAPAVQACTASETGGALGTVTTQRVASGPLVSGVGEFRFACPTVLIGLLSPSPRLEGRLQPSVSGLTLKNGSHTIGYSLYRDAGGTEPYAGGLLVVSLQGNDLLSVLNGAGRSAIPVYIVTTPGVNVPAGVYTDTVQVTWTAANICAGLLVVAGLCVGTPTSGTFVRPLTVTLTVRNDCTITAPAVNFGSAPLAAGFATVAQNIGLQCSRGMVYTVGLSAGLYPGGGRRQMASGTARLAYDIFRADNTVWGSAGAARAPGPGPATGVDVQTIPYTARIYPDQASPPAGTYTDNVVVDVQF